ncbi:MAG: hypothetical protein JNL72_06375 [Flavipsychrobacter sp.]|nr:hypothetical protein [Flavipsychrobacter sp.]
MYIRRLFISLFFIAISQTCLFISSCHFNSSYINREEDRKDGEEIIDKFYGLLINENYKESYKLFDKRFFEVTDTQKLNNIYNLAFNDLGKVESYSIEKWETEDIVGTDARIKYLFQCSVKRSNFASKETLMLIKEKDGIKIISYNVNADTLSKK